MMHNVLLKASDQHRWELAAYGDIQRVPFILGHPQCKTPGKRSSPLQSTLDILQTALAAMGLNEIPGLQGVNQLDS